MYFRLERDVENFLILGAGASVDYGLPTWDKLRDLVKNKLENDFGNIYPHKKDILDWMEKVGSREDGKKYRSIDECIKHESVAPEYHSNGEEIENEIFGVFRDIFVEEYKDPEDGWIKRLNGKILLNRPSKYEEKIAFINYNYDGVLNSSYLIYDYLPSKERKLTYKPILAYLEERSAECLYPNGNLFKSDYSPHIVPSIDTMKSDSAEFLDAVSCYDSKSHAVGTYNLSKPVNLFIAGLGNGLMVNLQNIFFQNPIGEIHVTIHDPKLKAEIVDFLSERYKKTKEEINIYATCDELIDLNFN